MIYLLPDSATAEKPTPRYVQTVLQGYKDMGFDLRYLYNSLDFNLKEIDRN
nr:MAG TPA: AIG2-like family protein [Caudoviricetes sp.]